MYLFTITYYDNSPNMYVKPLTMASDPKQVMLVLAATPAEATAQVPGLIKQDIDEYAHHVPHIGQLCSHVHEGDMARWVDDHAKGDSPNIPR